MIETAYILAGLVLLFLGGESLMRGSVSLARTYHISKLLISAVIIGFGTSMPEMTVSVGAALKGSPDIALGNVVGSNIANILLIIGISAMISPVVVMNKAVRRDVFWMVLSALLLILLAGLNALNLFSGLLLCFFLIVYVGWSIRQDRAKKNRIHEHMEEDSAPDKPYKPAVAALLCLIGLGALVGGANLLVEGAVTVARGLGVPEAVIGLTLVAVGTSLPELATAVMASLKKHSDVVVGNILGSNIFNILAILGVTATVKEIPVSPQVLQLDIWVMLLAILVLSAMLVKGITMSRWVGSVMLISYTIYTGWLYLN